MWTSNSEIGIGTSLGTATIILCRFVRYENLFCGATENQGSIQKSGRLLLWPQSGLEHHWTTLYSQIKKRNS